MSVYIDGNEELEQKIKLFDDVKKRNEEIEREMKKIEEENGLLKDELNQLLTLMNVCSKKKSICDILCSIEDLESSIDKCVFKDDNECTKEKDNVFTNNTSCDNKNVGWNIMNKMGYKGKGLGKHEQGIIEPILPTIRPKYEGLGYITDKKNDVVGSSKFVQSKQSMQCSNCNRKGHMKDKCWDLHPCNICGLKSHSEKMCWNRKCKKYPYGQVLKNGLWMELWIKLEKDCQYDQRFVKAQIFKCEQ